MVNIAKSYARTAENFGDLIEEGNLGLLRAVDSFDPEHGVRFSTYASWWIKQSIKRSLLENAQPIHIPTYMVELINHYRHIAAELESALGRKPTIDEMANEMNLPKRKAKAVKKIVETVEAGFQGDSPEQSFSLDETLKDDHIGLPEDELCDHEELEKAVMLLEEIDPRQAQILKYRFGLNGCETLTLKQIGEKLDLTRERVRQIQTEALTRLHELMLE